MAVKRHRVGRSGRRLTEAARIRAQAAERAALIQALGMKPEKSPERQARKLAELEGRR